MDLMVFIPIAFVNLICSFFIPLIKSRIRWVSVAFESYALKLTFIIF